MFNTTTIPTVTNVNEPIDFFQVLSILSLGLLFGASMVEYTLYRMKEHIIDGDEEEEEQEEELDYTAAFHALKRRELSADELTALGTQCVREILPVGNIEIIMTYDKHTESFWYYTDHLKEVSYAALETIAQKFAIEYDCKAICAGAGKAEAGAGAASAGASACETAAEEACASACETEAAEAAEGCETCARVCASACEAGPEAGPEAVKSVFASFKKYNTGYKGANSNFSPAVNIVEQANHFRFRGKLCDFNEQKIQKVFIEPTLDYATYKKLLLEKKDN
jgi:hypothetical protein